MSLSTKNPVGTVDTIGCTRTMEKVIVSHMFKIMDKDMGKGNCIESTIFYAGGYDWSIKYYPNNDLSIFLFLKSKSYGVQKKHTVKKETSKFFW